MSQKRFLVSMVVFFLFLTMHTPFLNKCKETFQITSEPEVLMPSDPLAQLYFTSLGVLGLFILYRLMEKSN